MRTNIDLDDQLVHEAMQYSKARSKRALVEEALRTYVEVRTSEQRRATYVQRLAAIRSRRRRTTGAIPTSPAPH